MTCFSSSDECGGKSSVSSAMGKGGVVRSDSAMVVAVILSVDEAGGEGGRITAREEVD